MKVSNCRYDDRHEVGYSAERPVGTTGHILMIIRSPARIVLKDQVHYTKGNCILLYHKETPQFFYSHNTGFVNDWVRFDLDEEDFAFLERIGVQLDTLTQYADVYPLSRIIKQLSAEMWAKNPNEAETKELLLRLLFLKLSDLISGKSVTVNQLTEKLNILRNNIYANPQNDWSIDTICSSLSISPSYLQHKYKEIFDNCIKDDVTESRIQYSKLLLTDTNHTVAAISRMVGYANDMTFMYMFKKKTGFTPSQYRNSAYKKEIRG